LKISPSWQWNSKGIWYFRTHSFLLEVTSIFVQGFFINFEIYWSNYLFASSFTYLDVHLHFSPKIFSADIHVNNHRNIKHILIIMTFWLNFENNESVCQFTKQIVLSIAKSRQIRNWYLESNTFSEPNYWACSGETSE